MIFKYYVNFDGEGEIGCFCKSKITCKNKNKNNCKEYIVKLIEISKAPSQNINIKDLNIDKLNRSITGFSKQIKMFNKNAVGVSRELKKANKIIGRIKK